MARRALDAAGLGGIAAEQSAFGATKAEATADLTLTTAYQAVTGCSVTVTPPNGSTVLVIVNASIDINNAASSTAEAYAALFVDGAQSGTDAEIARRYQSLAAGAVSTTIGGSGTKTYVLTGDGSSHVYTLRAKKIADAGGASTTVVKELATDLTVVVL